MDQILEIFFNWAIIQRVWLFLLNGLGMTVALSLTVVPLGIGGGLAVAVLHSRGRRWLNWVLIAYVDFFRAFPPLVLLVLIYFGVPFLQIDLPKFAAVGLAFFLNTSSYYGEIFRAGIESVPRGQTDTALSSGLSYRQAMLYVVLPQAIRNVLPDLISNTVEVIKLTTIASVVALPELLNNARLAQSLTYNPSPIMLAAAIYLVLLWPLVRLLSRIEHKSIARR
jgi:polar amino acid transport system permease protein